MLDIRKIINKKNNPPKKRGKALGIEKINKLDRKKKKTLNNKFNKILKVIKSIIYKIKLKIKIKKIFKIFKLRKWFKLFPKIRRKPSKSKRPLYDVVPPQVVAMLQKTKKKIKLLRVFIRTSPYGGVIVFLIILVFVSPIAGSIFYYSYRQTINIYPSSIAGDWEKADFAFGPPEMSDKGQDFSEINSAIYKGGLINIGFSDFDLIEEDFLNNNQEITGQGQLEEINDQKFYEAQVKFSLAWEDKESQEDNNEEDNPNNTLPVEESLVLASYSLDNGETWKRLGFFTSQTPNNNYANQGYFSFRAPEVKKWEDLEELSLKLEGLKEDDSRTFYLDSLWLEVEYGLRKELPVEGLVEEEEEKKFTFTKQDDFDQEIYLFVGGEEIRITENKTEDRNPHSDETSLLAWESEIEGRWQIFVLPLENYLAKIKQDKKSLINYKVHQITKAGTTNSDPWVSNGKVVWQGWFLGTWNIFLFDVEDPRVIPLTRSKNSFNMFPRVKGNLVIWQVKDENQNWQIKIADISDRENIKIAQLTHDDKQNEKPWFESAEEIQWLNKAEMDEGTVVVPVKSRLVGEIVFE